MQKLCLFLLAAIYVSAIDPSMVQLSTQKLDEIASSNIGKFIIGLAEA